MQSLTGSASNSGFRFLVMMVRSETDCKRASTQSLTVSGMLLLSATSGSFRRVPSSEIRFRTFSGAIPPALKYRKDSGANSQIDYRHNLYLKAKYFEQLLDRLWILDDDPFAFLSD